MEHLITFLLGTIGLTVLMVWPEHGPAAWLRERVLRRVLPEAARGVLDCYVCLSFWAGLGMSLVWRWIDPQPWTLFGCLMVPALFWIILRPWNIDRQGDDHHEQSGIQG